jgi:hypothetical protein
VCGIPANEVFPVTKKIPMDINDKASLEELEEQVPELKRFFDKYDSEELPVRWFINGIRGSHRQAGSHASGVLVSSVPLTDTIAMIQSKKNIVTGWVEGGAGPDTIINGDKTIKELFDNGKPDSLTSYDIETKELIENECSAIAESGEKTIYELELDDGKKIKCSENHMFLTKDGWKKLKDLKDEDEILCID